MGSIHQKLIVEATEKLINMGVKKRNIFYKYKFPTGRIDIFIIKNGRKIGIECLTQVQPKWIREKIRKYRRYLSKLIVIAPKPECKKLHEISGIDEIWESTTDFSRERKVPISISEEMKKFLDSLRAVSENYDDVIRKLRVYYNLVAKSKDEIKVLPPPDFDEE